MQTLKITTVGVSAGLPWGLTKSGIIWSLAKAHALFTHLFCNLDNRLVAICQLDRAFNNPATAGFENKATSIFLFVSCAHQQFLCIRLYQSQHLANIKSCVDMLFQHIDPALPAFTDQFVDGARFANGIGGLTLTVWAPCFARPVWRRCYIAYASSFGLVWLWISEHSVTFNLLYTFC